MGSSILVYNFVLSLAGVIMLYAGGSDALRYRIPNIAVLALLLLFPVFVVIAPMTVAWLKHLAVFGIVFVVGYPLYLKNILGAGDVKFLSATALWSGPELIGHFLFITALSGGILALGAIVVSAIRRLKKNNTEEPLSLTKIPLPYGVAIAIGGISALAFLSHPDLLSKTV